jgi:hypothetical protein
MMNFSQQSFFAILVILGIVGLVLFTSYTDLSLNSLEQDRIGQVTFIELQQKTKLESKPVAPECREETQAKDCDGYACYLGGCLDRCEDDDDCAAGYVCHAERCDYTGKPCTEATEAEDCSGYVCEDDLCLERCADDNDCASGYECHLDRCSEKVIIVTATIPAFDIEEHQTDDYLVFQLESFYDSTHALGISDFRYTSLYDESDYQHPATEITNAYWEYHRIKFKTPGLVARSYVVFDDHAAFRPGDWLIIEANVGVDSGHEDGHGVILSKLTDECGKPLYSLTIQDEKYHFIVSIDGTKYTLDSDTKVNGDDTLYLRAVYDGSKIRFFVNDPEESTGWVEEDSKKVSGDIEAAYDHNDLVLGRSIVCDDYQFRGTVYSVSIWGE